MTVTEYTDTLIQICEIDGSTTYVDAIISAARTAITAGSGTIGDFTSASVNGKSFTKAISLSPAQTLAAAVRAKRLYDDTESPQIVSTDFSRLTF